MKVKLDENLPETLVHTLSALGHDVDTVVTENLKGQADAIVWQAAQRAQRLLVTQDLDFSDIRRFKPGTHCGLLLVRLAKPGRNALARRVLQLFATEDTAAWPGSFIVATEVKLRVHWP